jgi:hypothetical protein
VDPEDLLDGADHRDLGVAVVVHDAVPGPDLQPAAVGHGGAEQRRLAGTVRSGQTVDPPPRHVQVDADQGDDLAETLGDPASPYREV